MRLEFCSGCGARLGLVAPCRCAACGREYWRNPKPGASAVVTRDGRVLLVRRAHEPERGRWEVPGGFCDPDEHPAVTAAREVLEETGLAVRVGETLGLWLDRYGDDDPPESVLSIYFLAEPADPLAAPHPTEEASEVGWFAPEQLPRDLAFPAKLTPALAAWRQRAGPTTAAGAT